MQGNAPAASTPPRVSPPTPPASSDRGLPASPAPTLAKLASGMSLIADGRLIEGRKVLSHLLFDESARLSPADAQTIRDTLASVNRELVFSKNVRTGDPLAESYQVQSGDLLARIAPKYKVTYQFLEQINGIDAHRLQAGQKIKLIKGPFHARIDKSDYRMDIYLRDRDGSPLYVCSFMVGLGEEDSTPLGQWIIEPGRKVVNPDWRNPRTGEYYRSDDPENPIGEYWLALKGTDEHTKDLKGYGIHGTIDPASIGSSVSMGCVRLADDDIEQVFKLLVEGHSTVQIVP